MDQDLKKTVIDLLQKRMDKCTNEQFWAVATLSGLDAFVLVNHKLLLDTLPLWVSLLLITIPAGYACWFIVRRHISYYFYRGHLSYLFKKEEGVPDFLAAPTSQSRSNTFSGVAFYVGIVFWFWCVVFGVLSYTSSKVEYAAQVNSVTATLSNIDSKLTTIYSQISKAEPTLEADIKPNIKMCVDEIVALKEKVIEHHQRFETREDRPSKHEDSGFTQKHHD